jgi:hypothetical protein
MLDSQTYKNEGWVSWADWLGYGVGQLPRGTFLSFEEARELVWLEGLTTYEQWKEWCDACSLSSVFESHRLLLANTGGPQVQVGQATGDGAKPAGHNVCGRGVAVVGRLAGHTSWPCGDTWVTCPV